MFRSLINEMLGIYNKYEEDKKMVRFVCDCCGKEYTEYESSYGFGRYELATGVVRCQYDLCLDCSNAVRDFLKKRSDTHKFAEMPTINSYDISNDDPVKMPTVNSYDISNDDPVKMPTVNSYDTTKNDTKVKRVFISGPIRDNDNYENDFAKAEKYYRDLGYSVFNPTWLKYDSNGGWDTDSIRQIDLEILDKCDIVVFLRDWQNAEGCVLEYERATKGNKHIIYEI